MNAEDPTTMPAARIGHEINNPLSCVSANLALALVHVDRLTELIREVGDTATGARADSALAELRAILEDARDGSDKLCAALRALTCGDASAAVAESSMSTEPAARRGRILVVDDEPAIGRIMERTLGSAHYVEAVTSARAALERIASAQPFDLILCDLMMPDMNGMDLYDALCRQNRALADGMIFVSGGASTPRAQAFLAETPNLAIRKPFDTEQLRAVVRDRLS